VFLVTSGKLEEPGERLLYNVEAGSRAEPPIDRVLKQDGALPIKVTCKVEEHDGGIGARWEHIGTHSETPVLLHRQHSRRETPCSHWAMLASIFSVPEADMRQWLNNSFTPYPALASALLKLPEDARLRKPVYPDVIAWNYEHAPGASSPRCVLRSIPPC
jgi:hypothetical protein